MLLLNEKVFSYRNTLVMSTVSYVFDNQWKLVKIAIEFLLLIEESVGNLVIVSSVTKLLTKHFQLQ